MSAVAEISRPDTAVMFAAYRTDLRLTKVSRYPIFGPGGAKVGEHPGQALQFRDGILRVTDEGVPLESGGMLPRDEALAYLRAHRAYGDLHEGFTEIHQAAPPVSQDELSAMMAAVWDEDALTALIEAEESGWNREALLTPAREALGRLREAVAQMAAQQDEAPKRAPKRAAG